MIVGDCATVAITGVEYTIMPPIAHRLSTVSYTHLQYIGQACTNSNTPLPGGYKLDSTTGKYHFQDNTNTNWFKEVFKTGIRQNHNVNLSGGGAHNTYNVSLDYYNQKGTLEGAGPNYERYTARVNNTMDTKFIKFHTSLVYSHSCLLYTSICV